MALDIYTSQRCFGSSFPLFRICNAYARPVNPPYHLVLPKTAFISCDFPYLVAGHFNIHNPVVAHFRVGFSNQEKESAPLFDGGSDLRFSLLNIPGPCTHFPFSGPRGLPP